MNYRQLQGLMNQVEEEILDVTNDEPGNPILGTYFAFRENIRNYYASKPCPESAVPYDVQEQFKPFLSWYKARRADITK